MSLFFYCILAVLIAFVIGRANRSIKLFWTLIIAFGIGAIGAAIAQRCTSSQSERKANVVTVLTPESGLPASIPFMSEMADLDALNGSTVVYTTTQVSRDAVRGNDIVSFIAASKTSGEPRGQPYLQGYYDTS